MERRHRIEIDNRRHALRRLLGLNPRLSCEEDERFKKMMYRIIEEPF